ncbi:MAG TPA: competence/damage-inducible protein A, partial [Flavisolibacter sp.]|nr:competence/damage-inducible protein A [Flavisolibacter sp.]
ALKLRDSLMKEVNACIITIGDELLIGQTIDTNSAFIAQELNKIGIWVKRRLAIGDVKEEILDALTEASKESEVIIITGGLGPTADDITKPTLCEYFKSKIIVDEGALQNLKDIFSKLNRPLTDRNLKQAEVPDNCTVLPNLRGTAPGMWFEKDDVVYVSLPGVPNEMKGLMQNSVTSKLKDSLDLPAVVHRTLLTSGIGESTIADVLEDFESNLPPHIKLAYLPSYGMVRLRLTGRGSQGEAIDKEVSAQFEKLKPLVSEWMVADSDITLQQAVSNVLKQFGKTVATAESCTGGYIAHLITSKAGSSAIFNGSIISYSNKVKEKVLGVKEETIRKFGAVSEQTVKEMVHGVLNSIDSDYALATSGVMGPDGGSVEKPVGMVWIAVGNKNNVKTALYNFRYDRTRNIEMTAQAALTMLRRFVLEQETLKD